MFFSEFPAKCPPPFGKLQIILVIKYLRCKNKDFDANMELYLKQDPNGMAAIRKKFYDLEQCSE